MIQLNLSQRVQLYFIQTGKTLDRYVASDQDSRMAILDTLGIPRNIHKDEYEKYFAPKNDNAYEAGRKSAEGLKKRLTGEYVFPEGVAQSYGRAKSFCGDGFIQVSREWYHDAIKRLTAFEKLKADILERCDTIKPSTATITYGSEPIYNKINFTKPQIEEIKEIARRVVDDSKYGD